MIAALIALIALLMLGGATGSGWTADLEKRLKHEVSDKTRREAALDAIDAYEEGVEETGKLIQEQFVGLLDTHIDFQSTEKDFDGVAQALKENQAKAFRQELKTREALKTNLTPEEWSAVFDKSHEK